MNQRDRDIEHASKHYDIVNDHDDQLRFFADGAGYARAKFAARLRELQNTHWCRNPETRDVVQGLIDALEGQEHS